MRDDFRSEDDTDDDAITNLFAVAGAAFIAGVLLTIVAFGLFTARF